MNRTGLWIRTAVIIAITLVGVYLVFGPRHTPTGADFTWTGIKNNLASNINLGLDLKGGSHLVMRVKTEEYLKRLTENNESAAVMTVKDAKDDGGTPLGVTAEGSTVTDNGNYTVVLTISDPSKAQAVVDAVKKKVDFANWTESTSGNKITWDLPKQQQARLKDQATEQAYRIIDSRINAFGVKEPLLQRQGSADSGQILLQMPGVENPERVKELVKGESRLELMKIVSQPNPQPVQTYPTKEAALATIGGKETDTRKVLPYTERDDSPSLNANTAAQDKKPPKFVVVESPAVVDGSELRDAAALQGRGGGSDYQISFSFKPSGAQKFGDWTGKNIGNYMAVVLNDEVKSAAFIKSQIFDSGEISGKFSKTSADDLALTLKSGALPAGIEYQEERTVGPSLGADSIKAGVSASIGGLVLVVLFMLFYYRGAGVNAVIALALNMLLTIGALIAVGSTLTLPGIAGLILGIGMAVDSNVLIFERIREELRLGFTVPESIGLGFDRAFVTIIDTHITTIISSVILYMTGSSAIKGFAVTLILGLLINLFTAVFVSRTIFNWELSLKPNRETL
ncbi:MAG TPA: protein translocase subunit SecD, partial [Pyrinomonadaceae bacterium]|nr:protein translocase subunit SecD [Pyrinomonadaceae bacterium]